MRASCFQYLLQKNNDRVATLNFYQQTLLQEQRLLLVSVREFLFPETRAPLLKHAYVRTSREWDLYKIYPNDFTSQFCDSPEQCKYE
jgi:hypothetical protein